MDGSRHALMNLSLGFNPDATRDAVDIAIPTGATLTDVARSINAAGAGVTAYVANGAAGAQLVMKGREGAANGFVIEAAGAGGGDAPGDLRYLGWTPATNTTQLQGTARDAAFRLDQFDPFSDRRFGASRAHGVDIGGVDQTQGAIGAAKPADIARWNPNERTVQPEAVPAYAVQYPLWKRLYSQTRDIMQHLP